MRDAIYAKPLIGRLLLPLASVCLTPGCTDHLIVPANHETLTARQAHRQFIIVEGRRVECWVERSPGATDREPEALVLLFVGKADRIERWIDSVATAWGGRPVEIWGMNYPGSGGSDGPARAGLMAPDALGTFDAMQKVAGPRSIFVHAGSLGTTVGLCVAAYRPVTGVVLQNPPPLRQLILEMHGWWNLWLLAWPVAASLPAELDSIANASLSRAPAIFISDGADEVVPPRYQRMVIDAYAGPKRVIEIPGGHHNEPLTREAAQAFARDLDWLWDQRKPIPAGPRPATSQLRS